MTFTTNLIPKTNGLTLGNSNYKWSVYLSTINGVIPPSTSGTSGQYLVSRGSSSAPEWATVDTLVTQSSTNLIQSGAVYTALSGKQNNLGFTPVNKTGDTMSGSLSLTDIKIYDSTSPTLSFAANSTDTNPAGEIFENISTHKITIRQRSSNGYTEDYALPDNTATNANKTYNILTSKNLDTTVTQNSSNPITSGAVYNAITSGGTIENANKLSTPRQLKVALASAYDSQNPVTFDGSANVDIPVNGVLPVANGGTGAATPAAALTNLGALSLNGGALSGPLTSTNYKSEYGYEFYKNNTAFGGMYYDDYNGINQIYIDEFTTNAKRECYLFPAPTNTSNTAQYYDILTTKNTISIAQGGTGATTRLGAAESFYTENVSAPTHIVGLNISSGSIINCGYTSLQDLRNAAGLGNTTGALPVANGGTGATNASAALTNLGAAASGHTHSISLTAGGTATVALAAGTAYTLTAGGQSLAFSTPADTNSYHTSGSWNNTLTYTATSNGGAGTLSFTIPTGNTATTVAIGNHGHSGYATASYDPSTQTLTIGRIS